MAIYNDNRKKLSYFAEERERNRNPNFYEKLDDMTLRRQVRRICQDIKNCCITEQDYIYFTNDRILSACISVSKEEWLNAAVTAEALNNYININFSGYAHMIYPYDITQKRIVATNQLNKMNLKANTWKLYFDVFQAIATTKGDINVIPNLFNSIASQNFAPRDL